MEQNPRFRERILTNWGRWAAVHWGKSLIIGAVLTAVLTLGVARLNMEMTFFSLMPGSSTQVQDLKLIMNEFPYASGVTVVVDGREIENTEKAEQQVQRTVDAMIAEFQLSEYDEFIAEVTGKMDVDFFRDHGLILSKPEDIRRFSDIYRDLNLVPLLTNMNNDFEKEYSGNEDNLEEDEELAVSQFRGLGRMFGLYDDAARGENISEARIDAVIEDFLFGETYFMSRDNRMAILVIQPTFTMEDLGPMVKGVTLFEDRAKAIAQEHGVTAGLTGLTTVGRDEMVTSEQGLAGSMLIAIILILLLMIFTFRMFSVPLISGIPLIIGIYWTMGLTGFTIHRLNIMTAMYMVALVGLGIDYAIHLLTTFIQESDEGAEFADAVGASFRKSGSGVITGAVTTAIAFFALQVAETEMMRELGLVAGLGIICELAAMLLLIPAFLGLRHQRREKKGRKESRIFSRIQIRTDLASGLGHWISKAPLTAALIMIAICVVLATGAGRVEIEQNLMNMEAKGLESVELQDTLEEEFSMAPDGLFILSTSLEEVKILEEKLKDLDSVKRVESIAPYLLTPSERETRGLETREFRRILAENEISAEIDPGLMAEELYRLQMNLLELSDMAYIGGMEKMLNTLNVVTGWNEEGRKTVETSLDRLILSLEENPESAARLADLQARLAPLLREKLYRMSSDETFTVEDLPAMFRNSYYNADGGEYLLMAVPTRNPWESDFRGIYATQMATVTDRATGMIFVSDQLNTMAESDGLRASLTALLTIFAVLLLDFRNLKLALLTMVPLACSFAALFGFMGYTGIKVDFVNIIAVPLLIGMGVDYAVHISHRYLLEGREHIALTVAKTGTAVLLTSITTIIAFASFIPSVMRAMRSTGIVLSIAIAFAFIFSIILHPALLQILVGKINLNIKPWKSGKEN